MQDQMHTHTNTCTNVHGSTRKYVYPHTKMSAEICEHALSVHKPQSESEPCDSLLCKLYVSACRVVIYASAGIRTETRCLPRLSQEQIGNSRNGTFSVFMQDSQCKVLLLDIVKCEDLRAQSPDLMLSTSFRQPLPLGRGLSAIEHGSDQSACLYGGAGENELIRGVAGPQSNNQGCTRVTMPVITSSHEGEVERTALVNSVWSPYLMLGSSSVNQQSNHADATVFSAAPTWQRRYTALQQAAAGTQQQGS